MTFFKINIIDYNITSVLIFINAGGHMMAQLVEALRYEPEGRGFDSRFVIGIFYYIIFLAALWYWC
jgi:hypothetical protein